MSATDKKDADKAKQQAVIPGDSLRKTVPLRGPRVVPPRPTNLALGTLRDVDAADLDGPRVARPGRNLVAAIGIDRYPEWPRLHNARSDALGAMRLFEQLGFEPVGPALIDEDATYEAIRRLVTDDLATLSHEDSLVLFFAGHGYTRTQVFEKASVKTGYIIPVDGDRPGGSAARWLRLDALLSDIARLPPRHILVILDACYCGIALDALLKWRGAAAEAASGPLAELRARQSRRVITSALDDQRALDSGPIPGHSLFTGCVVEALTGGLAKAGKRVATGSELWQYVRERVTSYPGSRQTPDYGALELDDRGELVMPLPGGARRRPRGAGRRQARQRVTGLRAGKDVQRARR
ncbi:MAG TPA: caspase family protein [Kofleriaceae bacterium]|nr:caspase family protein [Kofleriaceae bacterium]